MANSDKQYSYSVLENAILMSADIFVELRDRLRDSDDLRIARIIADEAEELDRKLSGIEDYDYYDELERHEKSVLKKWSPNN